MYFDTNDLRHINSMTKYPSIQTYHKLDAANGMLLEEPTDFGHGLVFCTEKINGTNGRIILFPDGDWIIGSREELLTSRGDRIANPALGIVAALKNTAARLGEENKHPIPVVLYGEVYGHGIEGGKQYTKTKGVTGFRLFDIVMLDGFSDMLGWPVERVASWRDRGGQAFFNEDELAKLAEVDGLELCPRIDIFNAPDLPASVEDAHAFLVERIEATTVALDGEPGKAEGLVLRTYDRSVIAKARFEDYERTLRRRAKTNSKPV